MRTAATSAGACLCLLLAAASAAAGTVTWPDGKREALAPDQVITGPGIVRSEDGKDTIQLGPGARLQYLGIDKDQKGNQTECFYLKSGAARADLGFFTRLATPAYWAFAGARGMRAVFRAEVFPLEGDLRWCHARTEPGSDVTRLLLEPGDGVNREVYLEEAQGVLVARERTGGVRFVADAGNRKDRARVRLTYPLAKGRFVDAYIGAGVGGALLNQEHGDVLAACSLSSPRTGAVALLLMVDGKEVSRTSLLPGMYVWARPAGDMAAPPDAPLAPRIEGVTLLAGPSAPAPGPIRLAAGGTVVRVGLEGGTEHPGRALVVLRNDGEAAGACSGELAFLRQGTPGSPSPFDTAFATFRVQGWKPGEERTISVDPPSWPSGKVLAVHLVPPGLACTPALTAGTVLLEGRVLVVSVESDLLADKPWIRFTLQNVDPEGGEGPPGELRYEIAFRRGGKAVDAGPEFAKSRPAGQPVGKRGDRFSILVEGLPADGRLAGTVPLLNLVR